MDKIEKIIMSAYFDGYGAMRTPEETARNFSSQIKEIINEKAAEQEACGMTELEAWGMISKICKFLDWFKTSDCGGELESAELARNFCYELLNAANANCGGCELCK